MLEMNPLEGTQKGHQLICELARRTAVEDDTGLVLNPPFQRAGVWTEAQQRRWIESLLMGMPLPAIFLNRFVDGHPVYGYREIVIDGQQRLRATAAFLDGSLAVRGERFAAQDKAFQNGFRYGVACPVVTTTFKTLHECAELYLMLLTAGTAHTAEDIEKARLFLAAAVN